MWRSIPILWGGRSPGPITARTPPPPGRLDTIPTASDTLLVNLTAYNDRGETSQTTDPQGTVKQSTFDDAGRITQLLENYVSGGTDFDQNRETDYTYN